MSAKQEILSLIAGLSDYECAHILHTFQDVAAGERFWETDVSTLYHEYSKSRGLASGDSAGSAAQSAPSTAEGVFAPIPVVKSYAGAQRVPLPAPVTIAAPLGELLTTRRSRRDYTGAGISLESLSTLLHGACGISGATAGYGYKRLPLRTFPSSGGLQAPEVYVSVQTVDELAPGLYHYHAADGVLELLRAGSHGLELRSLALDQECLETASAVVLVTGCFERLRWKYGDRAYKYMCMDIGYLGQNLYLIAEALGLGACAIAGFYDDRLEQFLALADRHEIPLLLTTIGVPRGAGAAGF